MSGKKVFRIFLIKPSHYDRDGYVIQWLRSSIPSNSLATIYGLAKECAEAQILGPDVEIEITAFDETNTVIPIKRIIRQIRAADGGFVGMVGVQSNQFPRTLDMARQLRAAEVPVVVGGFHVSGCMAMLPTLPFDIQEAKDIGVVLYAGEAEGRMADLIRDLHAGRPQPVYDFLNDLPGMEAATSPFVPENLVRRVAGHYTSFDAGRGCPYQCSFCTIINVQGRKSRYRTADDVEAIIRANEAQDVHRYFITDDNFARNKNWEDILDRMIHLREVEGLRFKFIMQVDMLCHKLPGFIEKAARAGCNRVFIGLENVNPDNLMAAKKRQNKIWQYREMLQEWKKHGIITYAGYILGFPEDTPESMARDIEIVKRELPVDLVEFFILTPLPGSEDHKNLYLKQVWMDPDMNKYDLNNVTTAHPNMSAEEWQDMYYRAWDIYFTPEHIETIFRRGAARGIKIKKLLLPLGAFYGSIMFEKMHPLEAGFLRRKVRAQRRPGLPRENPVLFYPRRVWETLYTHWRWLDLYLKFRRIQKKVESDPAMKDYTDAALAPVVAGDEEALELMKTHAGAIRHAQRRVGERPAGVAAGA